MNWYTDYPFTSFGDIAGKVAPKREVKIIKFERDPYVLVEITDPTTGKTITESIKSFYIYNVELSSSLKQE